MRLYVAIMLGILTVTGSGCTSTHNSYQGYFLHSEAKINAVTYDCAEFLAWRFPPATTQVNFPAGSNDAFSDNLKNSMRKLGFKIAEGKSSSGLDLSYVVDNLDMTSVLVNLSLSGKTYTRLYNLEGVPVSKWSVKEQL